MCCNNDARLGNPERNSACIHYGDDRDKVRSMVYDIGEMIASGKHMVMER